MTDWTEGLTEEQIERVNQRYRDAAKPDSPDSAAVLTRKVHEACVEAEYDFIHGTYKSGRRAADAYGRFKVADAVTAIVMRHLTEDEWRP